MADTDDKQEVDENVADTTPSGDSKDDTGEAGKSSKLDKVLNRLQGHGSADHSRESSPDPSVKESGGGRSSRRKPKVTRKVVDEDDQAQERINDDDVVDDAMNLAIEEFLNSSKMDTSEESENKKEVTEEDKGKDEKHEDPIDVDEDGNLILPEGTVVVQPEAVTDNKPVFKGPEFRSNNSSSTRKSLRQATGGGVDISVVHCSACNHQINTNSANSVKRHPVLKVILCKRCYNWYTSDEILQDDDGMDEQCRWCGEGGDLLCCDYCHNAFCKSCIRRNLGRGELSNLMNAGENSKWHCYVCDPKPLAEIIYNCTQIIDAIAQREKKRSEREIRKDDDKKKRRPDPPKPSPQPQKPVVQMNTPTGKAQYKSNTVMNLLQNARQNVQKKSPQGGFVAGQKVVPQVQAKQGMRPGQNVTAGSFVEWNFRINENNIIPIIDRAMMVTESMHMLLASLRDDVQKASTSNSSQRMMVKIESAGKLRRALTAFNKSFFDLSTFSQKTSAPTQMMKIMDNKMNVKQQQQLQRQKTNHQPVRPVQLVQHGQQVVRLSSGATVVQQAKNVSRKSHITTSTPIQKPKPVPSGEVIELLDSDDDSKDKTPPAKQSDENKEKDDTEDPKKKGFQLKVALGGPGHKLRGPLSARKRSEELEAKRQKEAKERAEAEAKQKGEDKEQADDKEESGKDDDKEDKDDETVKQPDDDDDVQTEQAGKEDSKDEVMELDEEDGDKPDDGADAAQDGADAEDPINDEELPDDDATTADNGAEDDVDDVQMDDANEQDSSKDQDNSDDLANFKNIEEQLKQLNGSIDESKEDVDQMEVDDKGKFVASDEQEDDHGKNGITEVTEAADIPQLDGTYDNRDSSSGSASPVSFQGESNENHSPRKKNYDELYASLQFEPLFNLDNMSSSNSDGEINPNVKFELGGDDDGDDLDEDVDENVNEDPMDIDEFALVENSITKSKGKGISNKSKVPEPTRRSSRSTKKATADDDSGENMPKESTSPRSPRSPRSSRSPRSPRDGMKNGKGRKGSPKGSRDIKRSPVRRTREDIEAQRELHRELLDDDSDDESDDTSDDDMDDESDDSTQEKSSGDEYNPRGDKKQLRDDRKLGGVKLRGRRKKGGDKDGGKHDFRAIKGKGKSTDENDSSDDEDTTHRHSKKSKSKDKPSGKNGNVSTEESSSEKKSKLKKSGKKSENKSDDSETETKSKSKSKNAKNKSDDGENETDSSDEETKSRHSKKSKSKDRQSGRNGNVSTDESPSEKKAKKSSKKSESDESESDHKSKSKKSKAGPENSETEMRTKKKSKKSKDESDESETNTHKSKKQSKKESRKDTNDEQSSNNEDNRSDLSDNFNSDLENDIEKLAKKPVFSKKKKKSKDESDDETKSKDTESNENKDKKRPDIKLKIRRGKTKDELVAELSSDEDEVEADPAEEDSEPPQASSGDEDNHMRDQKREEAEDNDQDARARKALLADDSSDNATDDEFGIEKKSRKTRSTAEKASADDSEMEDDYDSDDINPTKRKKLRTALLDVKISDSDSDMKGSKKRSMDSSSDSSDGKKKKGKKKKKSTDSDSIDSDAKGKKGKKGKGKRKKKKSTDSDSSSNSDSESNKKKKKRRRVKVQSDSSEANQSSQQDDGDLNSTPGKKKKKIRKIMKDKKLSETTKTAAQAEEERRQRVKERQKMFNLVEEEEDNTSPTKCPITTKLILEMDEDKDVVIEVDHDLVRKLKPHQVEAVQFMWDCVAETTERLQTTDGGGCILAHCMGLGKTLSVITLVSTLLAHQDKTNIKTVMVVCPLNTVLNWQNEFEKWLKDDDAIDVWEMSSIKDNFGRADALSDWQECGGVMIIGYDMYRNISTHKNIRKKKLKDIMTKTLVNPGPDLVVCDEGHILKNDASALSKAMNQVRTRRRIVLTGTPLQNNLVEYHCMVDFVKKNLLGTRKEFTNRFVNPINNGQCSDSRSREVKLMKRRAHILHDLLAGCVQRRDYSALTKFLMPKHEYIISVRLSPVQMDLYSKYLDLNIENLKNEDGRIVNRNASLFSDYNCLMRIWTHPWALKLDEIKQEHKRMLNDDSDSSFLDNETSASEEELSKSDSEISDKAEPEVPLVRSSRARGLPNRENGASTSSFGTGRTTRATGEMPPSPEDNVVSTDWWGDYMKKEDRFNAELGGKIMVLAEVLKMCESIGDKVLVFSQSLVSLDLIEDFLEHWDECKSEEDVSKQMAGSGSWVKGQDYYRMDGSTSAQTRKSTVDDFNNPENNRMRLFLISTRAGSLGINLVSANRVIVFDASWNPSHDVQSIFRVFRFGQTKPVYVYRFVAQGTMEEKIYERQVQKQSLSQRVVDEHQIERHFTSSDLQELYAFKPDRLDDPDRKPPPTLALPKDLLLAELLTNIKDWIYSYHEHDSLLENQADENLTEEEKKAAWEEFEEEKKGLRRTQSYGGMTQHQYALYASQQAASQNNDVHSIVPEAEQIARAIYAANPGITQELLQQKVHLYLQQRMDQHRLFMMQRQQEQERQRQMQEEMMKLQRLRLERYRQQEYLASMGTTETDEKMHEFTNLMQQLVGRGRTSGSSSTTTQDETPEAGTSGLVSMLRKQIDKK